MKTISEVVQDLKYNKLHVPVWLGRILAYIPFSWRPYVGSVYKHCKKEIIQYDKMTADERKQFIFQKVYHIVSYAIENVDFYKEYYDSKGFDLSQLRSYDDIEKIPVIDKSVLLEYSLEQRSNLGVKKYITNTGGSSGQTLTFYTQPQKIGKTWAHIHTMWSRLHFKPSNARMLFVGQNKVTDGAVYEFARHSVSIDIYRPLQEVAPSIKRLLKKVPCHYLHGYPSVIAEFAEYCENDSELLGMLKGKLRGVFLVSEYPYPMYRDVIERVFDVKTQSFYGHTEGCVMACESDEKFKFVPFQTYGFAEVIPDESGHFCLVGTAYDNEASPLIRYNTHDLVDNPEYDQQILKSFNIFEGRSGQFILDRTGKKISLTGLIMGRHHPLFDSCKHIQVYQKEKGRATIFYVPKEGVVVERADSMFDATNVAIDFTFERRDAPIRTVNGKVNLLVKDKSTPPHTHNRCIKVLFIGGCARNGKPCGGEQMKNKLLLERLEVLNVQPKVINTSQWRKRPWCLLQIIFSLLFTSRNTKVILSASHASGKLIKIIPLFVKPENVIYWSVGGDLDTRIENKEFSIESLNKLQKVIVQGNKQAVNLASHGLKNVKSIPNSKPIPPFRICNPQVFTGKFVYVSRIHPQKGVKEIVAASRLIKEQYPTSVFSVDFYGSIEKSFKEEFFRLLAESENCSYQGYLDLTKEEGYEKLSNYDCFLFPTYWPGEGFPGAIIDAYIAGLPIIATRWNLNEEMIEEHQTGYLIAERSINELADRMADFMQGVVTYPKMRERCLEEALKYDIEKVLSKELFIELGII